MRLIDADELIKAIDNQDNWLSQMDLSQFNIYSLINTMPTIERPQGECEKCDYRKFTENFIDDVVDWMDRYGITSIEQLSEILKGGAE